MIFIAHSLKFTDKAIEYEKSLGCKCYIPGRDTPQTTGEEILEKNRQALIDSNEVHVIWDGVSFGTLFDMGMAFGLNMPVKIIDVIPQSWTTYALSKKGKYL